MFCLGGFCLGGFWQGGFLSRGFLSRGLCLGGFCLGGFCPRTIRSEYQLYDRILRHRKIIVNKSDTVWNWAFNMPCKSLKGILVLFEEEQSYT